MNDDEYVTCIFKLPEDVVLSDFKRVFKPGVRKIREIKEKKSEKKSEKTRKKRENGEKSRKMAKKCFFKKINTTVRPSKYRLNPARVRLS